MKLVVFGLTVSSSWGNGHATLWRGLVAALARRGVRVVFFERDQPWYAAHRDRDDLPGGGELVLYPDWDSVRSLALRHLADADAAMVTSYCPDGAAAAGRVRETRGLRLFYDLDTPVTLAALEAGGRPDYLDADGLRGFDLVFSYTGGTALDALRHRLGAAAVLPLYGHADPTAHHPVAPIDRYRADLSYLGTYAPDRQPGVERLLMDPARRRPDRRFLIGGAQYPADFPWTPNIRFVRHLPPAEHPAFFCSGRLTLNVTRAAMAAMGFCPSGRLFEAAACGTPVLTDAWEGLDRFFAPGREIIVATGAGDALDALDMDDAELSRIGTAARDRMLAEHTADRRAETVLAALSALRTPARRTA